MRKLKSLMFAAILLLSSFGASATLAKQASVAKPALQAAEYNVAYCGRHFTITHIVVSTDANGGQALTTTYHMTDPSTVVKEDDPIIFTIKKTEQDKDNGTKFIAEVTSKGGDGADHVLQLNGYVYKNRIAFLLSLDGELGSVWYGEVGKVDDMVKDVDSDVSICEVLRESADEASLPKFLQTYLHQDDAPVVQAPAAPKP